MSLNAASQNPAGVETGPISGPPPPVSADTMADLLTSTKNDPLGQHESGKDRDDGEKEGKDDEKQGNDRKIYKELKGPLASASANSAAEGVRKKIP